MSQIETKPTQTIIHPLEPVYNADSRLLILGSFPSVKTRQYGFYYGNPLNRFWPLLATLFHESTPKTITERRTFLLRHHIAMYDSIYQCDIAGSSDATIRHVIPSDLQPLFAAAPIHRVYCNGATAYRYYQCYHAQKTGIPGVKLPSTSPANARYRLDDLVEAWKAILE